MAVNGALPLYIVSKSVLYTQSSVKSVLYTIYSVARSPCFLRFWLHPNAEIGYLTNQGLNVFSTIMKVSGGSGGGGGGDLNAATEYINTYSALLPADLDMSRRLTGGFAEALRAQSLHST